MNENQDLGEKSLEDVMYFLKHSGRCDKKPIFVGKFTLVSLSAQ